MVYTSYLFIGIICGILIERYLFPTLDIYLDVFTHKQTEKATDYQLNAQAMTMEFLREYPEANQNYQELQPAIGFCASPEEEQYNDLYEDDIDNRLKNKIGY